MKDIGATIVEREALHAQIEKLSHSGVLHGSESLCKLLKYLGEHSLDAPGTSLKEYQIATEVFGRPSDFDSRVDSTVRVQTGRLRSKLAEYYSGEGTSDRMVIEIPKGAYSLTYHPRPPAPAHPQPAVPMASPAALALPPPPPRRSYPLAWFSSLIAILAIMTVVAAVLVTRLLLPKPAAPRDQLSASLKEFWSPFISGPDAPLVVYSNAEFVGRPETGLRYFNPVTDSGKAIRDHYTGVGEVIGVHELDLLFAGLKHEIRIKRGRLLTMDDARPSDLIFIGSPSENLTLRDLPATKDFVFARKSSAPRKGDLMILNVHPGPGEQDVYLASDGLITEDYALVALTSGMTAGRRVLILAGISTFGTQAAVEFVCRGPHLDELISKLGPTARQRIPAFEALLRVKVTGGVPVHTDLLSVHAHGSDGPN